MPADQPGAGTWDWETVAGPPGTLVGAEIPSPTRRLVRVVCPDSPAFVLGSTQDEPRRRSGGLPPVVRRRSGGGGVLLVPEQMVWIDVVIPRSDPWWRDDVAEAAEPVGEAWCGVLGHLGRHGVVHRGALRSTPWSRTLCFAGVGPGEVLVGGRKVVGLAQRRTRAGACFQCAVPLRPQAGAAVVAAGVDPDRVDEATETLTRVSGALDATESAVIEAVGRVFPS